MYSSIRNRLLDKSGNKKPFHVSIFREIVFDHSGLEFHSKFCQFNRGERREGAVDAEGYWEMERWRDGEMERWSDGEME